MSERDTLPPGYFEALYARAADPWQFETSAYEDAKYAATIAALGGRRFGRALEIGCSIGVLSQRLAPFCDALLCMDVADAALAQARRRCAALPQARFLRGQAPRDWPAGPFDLILLSEVVYYLSRVEAGLLAQHVRHSLRAGGLALLVHWLGETDYPLTGDAAAELFITASGLTPVLQRREAEYRLDLLEAAG